MRGGISYKILNIITVLLMKNIIKNGTVLALGALIITISSLFWTTDIAYDTETIQHLEFGWPIAFEVQDQSRFDPPFPYPMNFGLGNPATFRWGAFMASFGLVFLILAFIWRVSMFMLRIFRR